LGLTGRAALGMSGLAATAVDDSDREAEIDSVRLDLAEALAGALARAASHRHRVARR
jgi:hypothetical protein